MLTATFKTTSPDIVTRLYAALPTRANVEAGIANPMPETSGEKNSVWFVLRGVRTLFAQKLAGQMGRTPLSPKQWFWAIKIAGNSLKTPATSGPKLEIAGILALLAGAADHLRFPKVLLATESGQAVQINRAGNRAKQPGTINVTDGEKFGSNKWFGRVGLDGGFQRARACTDEVANLLVAFAANPAKVAADHGKLTGACCFCRKALSDARSTDVGYGKTCAENYGLPWG